MAKKDERFIKLYTQGGLSQGFEIWIDTVTGVNYLYRFNGYSGGMTPLLDKDGNPVVFDPDLDEEW
ncbi:MAG: xylan 1,4-beta-xylosidase [Oscillospiraceae bacterium]|jgi:hypothetical protein|nr:xylan 1,4-beta-xylosidase [Oscillospiraceae bacterium]